MTLQLRSHITNKMYVEVYPILDIALKTTSC